MTAQIEWKTFLEDNKWTTYLAYQLKQDLTNPVNTNPVNTNPANTNPVNTLLKYEALLTQCSYLSRMAYCQADIFCRMTQHLDVTPNAFNNYIRAIEKIYDKLFNYKCSYDSRYIQKHPQFAKYFNPFSGINRSKNLNQQIQSADAKFNNTNIKNTTLIGFFVQNTEHMNVYLYVYSPKEDSRFNTQKTLFIAFKGSSSINDFIHDLKSAAKEDLFLSELNEVPSRSSEIELMEMQGGDDPLLHPGEKYGKKTENNKSRQSEQSTLEFKKNNSGELKPFIQQSQNNKKKIIPGKAGYGFIHVLKPSIQEICKRIEELKSHNFDRIIITGHSLGGALASLFGYYLKKYNSNLVNVPIHVVTFGACCVFDAPGRNEFNSFLNISDSVFTLDRVTSNFDPVIVLPVDLDHPGYTLLRKELRAFTNTGRTNEIGEIRKMLGLDRGYDGNDLLLSEKFVDLFTNSQDFKGTGKFDTDLYRSKFRIKFGSNAKEQQLILEKAMPDAKPAEIRGLFKTIESDAGNKRYDDSDQQGGLHNPFSKEKRIPQKLAKDEYKKQTEKKMPNQIQYSCYKTMTIGVCHASYMGVSYMMVLRLPNIKGGYKAKKEPKKNYTLYQKDGRVFSSSLGNYSNNSDCAKVEPNVRKNNNPRNLKSKNSGSFMNGLKSIFKKKNNKNKTKNSIGIIENQNNLIVNSEEIPKKENQRASSRCSIL
jgi:hypothetical protein